MVWGLTPKDTGNPWSVLDFGKYGETFDLDEFDMWSKESQEWLRDLCADARQQQWFQKGSWMKCYPENLIDYMASGCVAMGRSTCCDYTSSSFPFEPAIAEQCAADMVTAWLEEGPQQVYDHTLQDYDWDTGSYKIRQAWAPNGHDYWESLYFSTEAPYTLKAVVFYIPYTSEAVTFNVFESQRFREVVTTWFNERLITAPPGLQNGYLTSTNWDWLALQQANARGALTAGLWATAMAAVRAVDVWLCACAHSARACMSLMCTKDYLLTPPRTADLTVDDERKFDDHGDLFIDDRRDRFHRRRDPSPGRMGFVHNSEVPFYFANH